MSDTQQYLQQDRAHIWHPFTPMRQWCDPTQQTLVIERGEGFTLIDTEANRYIDGVSSLWCNVHGHRTAHIDNAIRQQLDKIAHTTLLGLASPPSIEFATRLTKLLPEPLNKVFYSDAGATALEVAFKMAIGYFHHTARPSKRSFIGLAGAYHGDTTGSMSLGYSELFHKPFLPMLFDVTTFPNPDAPRSGLPHTPGNWPSEDPQLGEAIKAHCLDALRQQLEARADEVAAIVIEPVMQGAAGMICQPPGFVRGVAKLAREHDVLLIADEVATGFARTGTMFACESEYDDDFQGPDILCLAKGITGGYLPLAATVTTDKIYDAFCGEPDERKTLYHGHTYTGNPLACAAAIASLELFEQNNTVAHAVQSAAMIQSKLEALRDHPHILDIRQRGLMVGIELCRDRHTAAPFDFSKRTGAALCQAMRDQGLLIRPLGDVLVLMPAPAMDHETLTRMLAVVVNTLQNWRF